MNIGLLLAAGAGRRMGKPKALVCDADGTSWLARAAHTLHDGGCDLVIIVLGAQADQALAVAGEVADVVVVNDNWADGMGTSLRAGLCYLAADHPDAVAAVVHLVDLPDVTSAVVQRLLAKSSPFALVRAAYHRVPGHPVLIGREHWSALIEVLSGDTGAKQYLHKHKSGIVECGDLATGKDVDFEVLR
jgi:CTP:molybdopterin cytidylyltransferase MocA